ncbi:MAG: DUF2799 domain-containing protein [Cellvibrionaceae bacterium]|nr:DUF2799 domain-containing protein [Cellvibrionaceae bacterium]MCV6627251.1 DUF2799 domain-containing protein [Cellvibrionaceae bacterium]
MARILLLAVVLLLSACSGLSKKECLSADWEALGFEDGVRGESLEKVSEYRQDCAEHGVSPDLKRYKYGREIGLEDFCKPQNGYQVGRRGHRYKGVCPQNLEIDFLGPYEDGRKVYQAERRLKEAEDELDRVDSRIDRLDRDIKKREKILLDDNVTAEQRRAAYGDIESYKDEQARLKAEQRRLIERRYEAKRNFAKVQARYGR